MRRIGMRERPARLGLRHRLAGGPTLWWDGRIVGGWAQDRDGEIVCRFLEDGAGAVAAADAASRRLTGLLGGVRLTARTRGMTWPNAVPAQAVHETCKSVS